MTDTAPAPIRVRLLHVPDCPLVSRVRYTLNDCLQRVSFPVQVEEVVGACASPTLVIDGLDAATGLPPPREVCCRLDLPTCAQIDTALSRATGRGRVVDLMMSIVEF